MHAGNFPGEAFGSIRTPIVTANSYELPDDPSAIDWSGVDERLYTRNSGVNQVGLEQRLAHLEEGEDAVVLASGVAAIHAVCFAHLKAGDHVAVSDVVYEATWRLFTHLLPDKYGIEATFVDVEDHDAVRRALRPDTRLLFTEVLANPTTKVADIPALAGLAHEAGAFLAVDSTFTPPPLYRPLTDGADLVIHSLTKYINGHGDAMGGAVIGRAELVRPVRTEAMVDAGGVISPFNAWLITRGAVTLPLRMRQHQESALAVAEFLAADSRVAFVSYPGLPAHPGHELASRLFAGRGFGGMLAFALDGPPQLQNRFVAELGLVTSAVSLGHDESLIVHVGTDGPRVPAYPEPFRRLGHLRLSVGLEDSADILADLAAALDAARG